MVLPNIISLTNMITYQFVIIESLLNNSDLIIDTHNYICIYTEDILTLIRVFILEYYSWLSVYFHTFRFVFVLDTLTLI